MALWAQISQQLPNLSNQTLSELYPDTFPIDVRHYLASWIEGQRWYRDIFIQPLIFTVTLICNITVIKTLNYHYNKTLHLNCYNFVTVKEKTFLTLLLVNVKRLSPFLLVNSS